MPEIATDTTEAVLSSWPLPEGSSFSRDDVIATVETAKAVVDVPAEADGVLLRLLVAAGTEVAVGTAIALIGTPGEQAGDLDIVLRDLGAAGPSVPPVPSVPVDPVALEVPEAATTPEPSPLDVKVPAPDPVSVGGGERVFASPLARRLVKEAGLRIEGVTGTGHNGRIVRRDVERARSEASSTVTAPEEAGVPAAAWTDVPHSRLRRLVASRLTESKQQAPHFYLRATVTVDRLLALRAELNEDAAMRVSVNDLVVKAVAGAHVRVPELNVTWGEDAVRAYSSVGVSVAVATDRGLVTPVLRAVEDMTVTTVASTVRDLAERARSGRLQQHELEGGSISITNLGMFGTEEFAAIINPPQAAILAVGAARQEPVAVDGRLEVATVMRLTLSVDHRPVDGVVAARWMAALVTLLEHPARILA